MAGNIFINYRREDSGGVAGRLHDRMAQAFGSHKLFMDVDNIPVGVDFEGHLKSQVAACDAMVAVIGSNWLGARDETGLRRLDNPDDFVTIEIATALARNIPVIPVLLDGARMPKASELPDSLKPLARRQAFGVRHAHFGQDAESLIAKMKVTLGQGNAGRGWWRLGRRDLQIAAVIVVVAALSWFGSNVLSWYQEAHAPPPEKDTALEKTGDDDRAIADFSEAIRLNPKDAFAFGRRALTYAKKGDYDRAIADDNEAIRLDPKDALAFHNRAFAYAKKGDYDRAIADDNEAIRLNPQYALAFHNRAFAYARKGDHDRAIADYNEAIRLYPTDNALALCNRGKAKLRINDNSGNADIAKARELDASACR